MKYNPVSYTHLFRPGCAPSQPPMRKICRILPALMASVTSPAWERIVSWAKPVAVSYTPLDVYKSQQWRSGKPAPSGCLPFAESFSCLRLLLLPLGAGHVQAQFLHGDLLGIKFAHDLALVHDQNAVGKVHDLIQLQRDQQHGLALVPLFHQLAVDVLDGAYVQTAGCLLYTSRCV